MKKPEHKSNLTILRVGGLREAVSEILANLSDIEDAVLIWTRKGDDMPYYNADVDNDGNAYKLIGHMEHVKGCLLYDIEN